jgi:carboxyl-terminal processing protease
MKTPQKPLWHRIAPASLAALAIGSAVGLTYLWPQRNGLDLDIDSSARAQEVRSRQPYDLTQLTVMNRVILQVKDHYVDPERVSPQRMLLGGLNAVQQTVAPVLIHYEDGASEVAVQVYGARRMFRVSDVTSPWALSYRWREIFGFLQENLRDEDVELREIEYAAINGMLRTLDPHSILLDPETYTEMQMSTRGEFGGLGIVISIRDGQLTIIRPMPETPAARAGLVRMDRIVRIGEESTLNMPLEDAVSRLRGPPGSTVQVWVTRAGTGGWTAPRRFDLVRAVIHIESVESRMLEGSIGYVSISSFQGNTFEDMRRALAQLHAQGMRGLVLDLRDDPGGLLDQAVRIADAFLDDGIIVTTSSSDPSQRDERSARREGTEPDYPMIVLINGGSASASEIVAGALKNHDRALVVGQTSFGKGSVQVLYNYDDGSALKLTIAQYLTPGEVSIQGVGIVPDIAIDPMTVDRIDLDLEVDQAYIRESDLQQHLTSTRAQAAEEASVVMRYYLPRETRERLREAAPEDQEENEREDEFLLRFAREVLAHSTREGAQGRPQTRRAMIEDAQPVIARLRDQEMQSAVRELQTLGVDWSEGSDQGASTTRVELSTNAPENRGTAGESFELTVRVTNTGTAPLYQLRAQTRSDFALFNQRELVFGKIEPGQTREWTTTLGICSTEEGQRRCTIPREVPDRADGIRVEFSEAHGHAPTTSEIRTQIRALPRPQFAYHVQIADDVRGNGDGAIQRGELGSVYLRVRNTGTGRTYDTQANIQSRAGEGVLLHAGRFEIDDMQPGEERLVHFTFEVLPDFAGNSVRLEARVADVDLREVMVERIDVPIEGSAAAPTARRGRVTVRDGAMVRARPSADSATFARVQGGAISLAAQAELAGFVRVDLGEGRPGWVASGDLGTERPAPRAQVAPVLDHMPPRIDVDGQQTLVTTSESLPIRAVVTDDALVRDAYIYVGTRKVFYVSNRDSQTPREVRFDSQVPLRPGINVVVIVARENDEVLSRRTFIVRRDAPDGALMETPRAVEDWFHLGVDGAEE